MIDTEKLKSVYHPKKISEEEYTFLKNQFSWINSKKEGIACLRQNITEEPICGNPECNNTQYFNMSGTNGYTKGCSKSCTVKITMFEKYGVINPGQLQSSKEKVKKTVREKYGCDNVFQAEEIKEQSKKTMMEKHGVEFSSQRPEYNDLVKTTCLEKYGTESPNQCESVKEKFRKTSLEKYGVENPSLIPGIRRKAENTMNQRYGKYHYAQTDGFKEQCKQTSLEKYGVEHPMMDATTFHKHYISTRWYKEYKWKSGHVSLVQGNEPIVLNELENKGYTEVDVLTDVTDMPKLWYIFENKKRRYYPDIYIPNENKIIEVKSNYTLNKDYEKNQAKFQAVRDAGFIFQLEVR